MSNPWCRRDILSNSNLVFLVKAQLPLRCVKESELTLTDILGEPHLPVPRAYSLLCAWGSLLAALGEPYDCQKSARQELYPLDYLS